MCQGNPVLRVLGFSFLLIAFLAAIVAFLVPFWIRNEKADPEGFSIAKLKSMVHDKFKDSTEIPTSTLPYRGQTIFRQLEDNRKKRENLASQLVTMVSKLKPTPRQEEDVWFWEGLWANCQTNFSCTCVFEDEMALEKASSGLYSCLKRWRLGSLTSKLQYLYCMLFKMKSLVGKKCWALATNQFLHIEDKIEVAHIKQQTHEILNKREF